MHWTFAQLDAQVESDLLALREHYIATTVIQMRDAPTEDAGAYTNVAALMDWAATLQPRSGVG